MSVQSQALELPGIKELLIIYTRDRPSRRLNRWGDRPDQDSLSPGVQVFAPVSR